MSGSFMPDQDCQNSSTCELCVLDTPIVVSEVEHQGTLYNCFKTRRFLFPKQVNVICNLSLHLTAAVLRMAQSGGVCA